MKGEVDGFGVNKEAIIPHPSIIEDLEHKCPFIEIAKSFGFFIHEVFWQI